MGKRQYTCALCAEAIDKDDALFVDENTFAYMAQPPAGLVLGSYCMPCYDSRVRPEIEIYEAKVERAKDVNVFYTTQGKESRFVRRIEKPVRVENCSDRDDVVMHLAFLAVEVDKNSLVDVEVSSQKVRIGSYQTSTWSGRGVPAQISDSNLNRKYLGSPN